MGNELHEVRIKNKRPIRSIGERRRLLCAHLSMQNSNASTPGQLYKSYNLQWALRQDDGKVLPWAEVRMLGVAWVVGMDAKRPVGVCFPNHPRMFAQRTSSLGVLIRDTVTGSSYTIKDQRPRRNCWPGNFFRGETVCGLFHIYPLPLSLTWC